jgi:hypothetical protein
MTVEKSMGVSLAEGSLFTNHRRMQNGKVENKKAVAGVGARTAAGQELISWRRKSI